MDQAQHYKKAQSPPNETPEKKLKAAPPFAHGIPPLPTITGDQPNDPPDKLSLTGFTTSSPQTLPTATDESGANEASASRKLDRRRWICRSLHLPGNPNLTNRHHPTSPFTQSRRYSSHRATACVCSLPDLTTPDGNWTELRQNEQREEVKKKSGNVFNQQKMGSGDGTDAHAPAVHRTQNQICFSLNFTLSLSLPSSHLRTLVGFYECTFRLSIFKEPSPFKF
ncbi:hypothetical protein DY000_02024150 [Brassica cretica]|uniref:Uncharacterized protein n=1 Tax=Brassica cretica TaxID=69181 RepID=A0ABQ7ECX0_BRACR|nr:hypothetical protein DY000_02024150 [Brassica cretica]